MWTTIRAATRAVWSASLRKEGLAFVALIASIAGCGVLSAQVGWIISILETAGETESIANIAYGLIAIEGMAFLSLTLLLGRRSVSAKTLAGEITVTGGD